MSAMPVDSYRLWSTTAGSGVPVVLLHGALSDFRYWEPQQIAFARRRQAIAVSLRGYFPDETGGRDAQLSAEQHVSDLGVFLRSLGQPAHLLGHSRGGRIALHVAAKFPDTVRTLVLFEPGGIAVPDFFTPITSAEPSKPAADVRSDAWALIQRGEIEAGLRLYIDSGHGAGTWDGSPLNFKRVAMSNAGSMAGMMADVSAPLSRSAATQVTAPTLLMDGANSPPIFGQVIRVLSDCVPKTQRSTIDGGTHFLNLTHPDAFNRAVEDFWSAHEVDGSSIA
jgi:pimeloyl-ACP methyl ester carboxylesterase